MYAAVRDRVLRTAQTTGCCPMGRRPRRSSRVDKKGRRRPCRGRGTHWAVLVGAARESATCRRSPCVKAVDWSYSQTDARRLFHVWWARSAPSLTVPNISATRSVYLPFWVFIADVSIPRIGVSMHREAPSPALQLYAGSQYPRKMTEVSEQRCSVTLPPLLTSAAPPRRLPS